MKKILICLLLLSFQAMAGHYYEADYYPTEAEALKISARGNQNTLNICCHYPQPEQIAALKMAQPEMIIIRAGSFPSASELQLLKDLGEPFSLELSEVFPSDADIARLNNSNITELRIISRDFPYLGEVEALNKFSIPVRFDITKRELPTMEHMIIIRQFKSEITVGFHHRMVPGPGYASFFNSMPASKVFVVHEQFPYGIDAIGMKEYQRTKVEIAPEERMMSQDVPVLNEFTHQVKLDLNDIWPMNAELMGLINQVTVSEIRLMDDGMFALLGQDIVRGFSMGKSKITLKFSQY